MLLLSTHADRQGVDISFTVCFFVRVCTVTDFSAEDKAIGIKFSMAVYRRPRQGNAHFCELGDRQACGPRLPACKYHGMWIGMCGYTAVPERRRYLFISKLLSICKFLGHDRIAVF